MGRVAEIIYASGKRGPQVRPNGLFGTMPRGWYYRTHRTGWLGPFTTERKARFASGQDI